MKTPVRLEHPSIALQKQADEILKTDQRGIWAEPKHEPKPERHKRRRIKKAAR